MSSKHQYMNLSVEHEELNSDSFLDVKICLKNGKCVTSFSKKPTFSRFFPNYESFALAYQKRELLYTSLNRSFHIYCDFKTFHLEIEH